MPCSEPQQATQDGLPFWSTTFHCSKLLKRIAKERHSFAFRLNRNTPASYLLRYQIVDRMGHFQRRESQLRWSASAIARRGYQSYSLALVSPESLVRPGRVLAFVHRFFATADVTGVLLLTAFTGGVARIVFTIPGLGAVLARCLLAAQRLRCANAI